MRTRDWDPPRWTPQDPLPAAAARTVYEPEPPQKPLLYDHKGRPLVRAQNPVGFRPPKKP